MKRAGAVLQIFVVMGIVSLLGLAIPAWADVTLSGSQTRGMGTDGKLRSSGVNLPQGGVVVSASDAGAGLWLQGPNGQILRFTPASRAVGAQLSAGMWYAYPNLPTKANTANCAVTIQTAVAGVDGSYTGTWGEQGRLSLTVKKGVVTGILTGTDSSGTVISVNLNGTIDPRGNIQASTNGSIKASGKSMAAGGAFTGRLANNTGSGSWNFTIQAPGAEPDPTPWKVRR